MEADGLSYADVGKKIGMSRQHVHEVVSGKRYGITVCLAVDISRAMGVDMRKAFPNFKRKNHDDDPKSVD